MDDSEERIRRREFKIVPRQLHPEQDCRLRDFAVLSTFNEAPSRDGRPVLLIPGQPPSIINDDQPKTIPITVPKPVRDDEKDPTILTIADMPPDSFDNLLRSLPIPYFTALAASPKTIITDAATLAYLFRLLSGPVHHYRADVWVNMQAAGQVLFMRSADSSADKVPRVRAAERVVFVEGSGQQQEGGHCRAVVAGVGKYKRVVRWRMADLELVVKDAGLVAVPSCAEEESEGEKREAKRDGARNEGEGIPIAELSWEAREEEVQHVRVVGNIGARSQCDAGFYFSGCDSALSFWVQTAGDGKVEVAGPKQRHVKPKVGLWEEKNAEVLRALAHFLDRARELVCKETRRTPGAKFAGNWRTSFSFFKIWYAAPHVDGGIVQFSRCPYLLSEDFRRRLEKLLEDMAPRARHQGTLGLEQR